MIIMERIKIIAFYLPQFHPFPENDEWWGKGFTEWTNVAKAKPLFRGHYQPKIPSDLGFYDLRLPIVREEQAKLAREAGVYGFCYWHYWFGQKQLMNDIIDDVLDSGEPDFPFCLGWANESWKAKLWNKDGRGDKTLIEQTYGGLEDYRAHFDYAKRLFKDKRYIRIDGKPFFLIYRPNDFADCAMFIELWNKWAKEEKISDGVYFVANMDKDSDYPSLISMGFDAVTPSMKSRTDISDSRSTIIKRYKSLEHKLRNRPFCDDFEMVSRRLWRDEMDMEENVFPFLIPNWDHSPRSGKNARVFIGSTPEAFQKQAESIISKVKAKHHNILMLKSWNEWGEGNYMEPDLKFGKGYIAALRNVLEKAD